MSPTYYQRRKAKLRASAMAGVRARERKRQASFDYAPCWHQVGVIVLTVYAGPDGRTVEIHAHGPTGKWARCGSERSVRGALAKLIWRIQP